MDIKALIASHAPTKASKRATWLLLICIPSSIALLEWFHPLMQSVELWQLRLIQLGTAAVITLCASLYLNVHFFRTIKFYESLCIDIQKQASEAAKQVAKSVAAEELAKQENASLEGRLREQVSQPSWPKKYHPFDRLKR